MNNQNTINNLYLCHFNPNHDPRNGQFTKSSGGSSKAGSSRKPQKKGGFISYPKQKAAILGGMLAAGAVAGAASAIKSRKATANMFETPQGPPSPVWRMVGGQVKRKTLVSVLPPVPVPMSKDTRARKALSAFLPPAILATTLATATAQAYLAADVGEKLFERKKANHKNKKK